MIIDSHAHYSHASYKNTLRYLTRNEDGYCLAEGDLPQILQEMRDAHILCSIEPGISLASNEAVLQLCNAYPDRIFPAMGVHPTRAIHESWRDRKRLKALAEAEGVIAIGETGLDYHYARQEQHRMKQHIWFLYQLDLAWKRKMPVILHVRDAHKDALRILKRHPARHLGGVVHCFNADWEIARQYLALGYHIGIGGAVLQLPERAEPLWDAVRQIPLDRILLETDAPYILPYCKDTIKPKQLRRARNSSLILPDVAAKIGALQGVSAETVERITTENALRLFRLPI